MTEQKKPENGKRGRGRPSLYSEELANRVCELVADGCTLTRIDRMADMPARRTISDWESKHPVFSAQLQRAREAGFDAWADECFDIADDGTNDWIEMFDKDGVSIGWKLNAEHVQRSKLRIETRLKVLAMVSARHRNKTESMVTVSKESDNPLAEIYAELSATIQSDTRAVLDAMQRGV